MDSNTPTRFDFSQSSLQDYSDCPRRFQLRYVEHMPWPAVEAELSTEQESRQQEGLRFHRLVHQHLMGVPSGDLAPLATSQDLRRWWDNYASSELGLESYLRRSEVSMFCRVGDHRLVAKYDLIAVKDGQALIYDWKTYTRRPRNDWLAARWQTRIYRALLVQAGAMLNGGRPFSPDDVKMVYWFAEFPREPAVFNYDARQFRADWAEIGQLISEITAERHFALTPDRRLCRWCVYRSYCDRGDRAAKWNEVDEDSVGGESFDVGFEQIEEIEF